MLRTADGREYIDGLSALWNVNIGHGRKELADAAAAQMEKLAYASAYAGFTNEPAIRLAERIVALPTQHGGGLFHHRRRGIQRERIQVRPLPLEAAGQAEQGEDHLPPLRLSRRHHGGDERHQPPGYHKMFGPLVPEFLQVAPPYPYRWPGNGDAGIGAADAVEEAILANGADTIAAVIAEPVMGAGGVIVPPATYFPRLREICDRHDVLLIADEVITGFGRTGQWFALGHWGIEPDLMSFAKGVTSGYVPLGGVIVSKHMHNDRGRAAGRKVHARGDLFGASGLLRGRAGQRRYHRERGPGRARPHHGPAAAGGPGDPAHLPAVGDVRGIGMMAAVELVEDQGSRKPAIGLGGTRRGRVRQARPDHPSARRRRWPTGQRRFAVSGTAADDAGGHT